MPGGRQNVDSRVEQFFSKLPESKRRPARLLREIVLSASKEVKETVRWTTKRSGECLAFTYEKDNIAFIYTFPKADYINLGFFFATHLDDPEQLFQGTGKGMRHVKVHSEKDIPVAQMKKWVRQAVKLLKE
jgi:hypothetical protein